MTCFCFFFQCKGRSGVILLYMYWHKNRREKSEVVRVDAWAEEMWLWQETGVHLWPTVNVSCKRWPWQRRLPRHYEIESCLSLSFIIFNMVVRALSQLFFLLLKSYWQVVEPAFGKTSISFMTLGPGSKCVPACSLSFKDMLMWNLSPKAWCQSVPSLHIWCTSHDHIPSPSLIKVPSKQLVSP